MPSFDVAAIQLIYAGGTFGSYGRPLAPLAAPDFLPVLQTLLLEQDKIIHLPSVSWLDNDLIKDSSQLTPCDFVHFYGLLLSAYQAGQRQFVLITGTDTLSYLGAFLSEAFAGSDICLIITGSMCPLLDDEALQNYTLNTHSDAWHNFSEALKLAHIGESGVRVCFGGESWLAQTVQKMHSHDFRAFTGDSQAAYSANHASQILTDCCRHTWVDKQLALLNVIQTRSHIATVQVLYCVPNNAEILNQQLQTLLSQPPCGIILLGFGAGNIPYSTKLANSLQQAYEQGHMVICASQCSFGGVNDQYAAGSWQYEHQVIAGGKLTIAAIYARLLWLLLRYASPTKRRQRWTNRSAIVGDSTL